MKKLFVSLFFLFAINIGWSQVICEKCDCEEEEIENAEGEGTDEVDYTFKIDAEGEENFVLDEVDILGEEVAEGVGEGIAEEAVAEVAEEVVVEVATEAISEGVAIALINAIPVVGQIIEVVGILALAGYELYKLFQDTDEKRREHEIAIQTHNAELLEHNSWNPLFPSFSVNINDLESKRDTISFIFNTIKFFDEQVVEDYLNENRILCEGAFDQAGYHRSIPLSTESLTAFTPCAFESYFSSYTAGPTNQSFRNEYRWTLPEILLSVEGDQVKTNVKMLWATDFINQNNTLSTHEEYAYDNLELKLATHNDNGFMEITDISYVASDNKDGTISIRVNNFDISQYNYDQYFILVKATAPDTYAHAYEYGPTQSYMYNYSKSKITREKFKQMEKKGNYDQQIDNFYHEDDKPVWVSDYRYYIKQLKMSPSFAKGVGFGDGVYKPMVVSPSKSKKVLFYAQLRDYQPYDTEKTAMDKKTNPSEINVFPSLKTASAADFSSNGIGLKESKNGKNHFVLEYLNYIGAKEISYIELINLNLDENIICQFDVTHEEDGLTKSLKLNATSHQVNKINSPIKVNAIRVDSNGNKYLANDSSLTISTDKENSAWLLQNLPLIAGEKMHLTVHYEDGTLSKKLISIPSDSTPLERAYYTLKTIDENENSFLTTAQNEYEENIISFKQNQNALNNDESQWLIEHYGGNLYTFMNSKSKKVLAIKDGSLGLYFWDPYDFNQFWHIEFLENNLIRLRNAGAKTFVSGDIHNIYHDFSGDELEFEVSFAKDAEAILSDEERFIISRENSRYLSMHEQLYPSLCVFDETPTHTIRMLYQGNLHYTIENVNEDIDSGGESNYALHSNREYHNGKLSWNATTTTPWLFTKIDDQYFALSSKDNWIEAAIDKSKKCSDVLSEVYGDNIPTDEYSKHFSFGPPHYPDYSLCESETETSQYEWIEEIILGQYNNFTGNLKSNDNYSLYSFKNWNFTAGESYDLGITAGVISNDPRYYTFSMDLNRNGLFESNEIMFSGNAIIAEDTHFLHSKSLNIPEDITPGPIRIRVALGYNSYPANCESFFYGEVEDYIVTIKPKVDYSNCQSENHDSSLEWIDSFSMGSYTNNSGNNNGYTFFENEPIWYFNLGEYYDLSYTIGLGANYMEDISVWIDVDQSGYFEDRELIYNHNSYMSSPSETISGERIQIPREDIAKTGKTRMRVALRWNNRAPSCGNYSYGEVEDYNIWLNPFEPFGGNFTTNNTNEENQNLSSTTILNEEVAESSNVDIFTLHPNPASDILLLNFVLTSQSLSEGSFIIYNILGQEVKRLDETFTKGSNQFSINIKDLSAGMYTVLLNQSQTTKTHRKRLIIK